MARAKVTTQIDERLLRGVKQAALRAGRSEAEIYEEAVRAYLGWDVLEDILSRRSELTEEQAMAIAVEEARHVRAERAAQRAAEATSG